MRRRGVRRLFVRRWRGIVLLFGGRGCVVGGVRSVGLRGGGGVRGILGWCLMGRKRRKNVSFCKQGKEGRSWGLGVRFQ